MLGYQMDIGIFGAGAIGAFIGVRLSAAGAKVRLLARPDVVAARGKLEAIDRAGHRATPGADLEASDDPAILRGSDVVLVTVKSADTSAAGETLAELVGSGTLVVSFQNGLHNARRLREHVRGPVVQGIVTYNVFRDGVHRTQQATEGKLFIGEHRAGAEALKGLCDALERAGEDVELTSEIDGVVRGKLLLNLNNGVCAATGLGIQDSLRDRDARWIFAECIAEGVRVFRAEGVWPISPIALPVAMIPRLLQLPNALVLRVAKGLVNVHPDARSSTLQDLERGRVTEIDELNGAIVTLGRRYGVQTPANTAVRAAIAEHEAAVESGKRPSYLAAKALRATISG